SLALASAALVLLLTIGAPLAALRQLSLKNAAEAQRRLNEQLQEQQYSARAVRLMDQGDLSAALPWIVACLRLAEGQTQREEMHRFRLAAVLRHYPRQLQVWFHDGPVTHAEFSPDGRRVVTASRDRTARVWDANTGQ